MPSVIDSLVVTLGLDAKQYKQGSQQARDDLKKTREAAKQTAVDMEARGKQAALFFSKLRNEALMFVGVLAGAAGIKAFTTNIIGQARALGFQSQALDMNIKRLQAWEKAARQAGASRADVAAQLAESQNAIAMTRRGLLAPGVQEFRFYGGKGNVQGMTPEQYLLARFATIQSVAKQSGIASARLAAHQMGVSDALFNFSLEGNGKVIQQLKYFEKLSGFTKRDAESANILTDKFNVLEDRAQLVGVRIASALIPYLQKLVDWFNKIAAWVDTHQTTITRWMNDAIRAVKGFWKEVSSAAKAVGGWKNVLIALGALKVLSWISPFNALATALLGVGAALKLIGGAGPLAIAAIGAAGAVAVGYALYNPLPENVENDNAIKQLKSVPKGAVMDRAIAFVEMLQKRGMGKEHAQGVVGNLMRESSMNPNASSTLDGKTYVGLAQWGPDGQAQFKKLYGRDLLGAPVAMQADFLMWQLSHTEKKAGDSLRRSPNNQVAARVFQTDFERTKNPAADLPKSQGYAAAVHNAMLNRPDVANGPVMPLNTLNVMRSASSGSVTHVAGNSSSTEVSVGNVTINTTASDIKGVGSDLGGYIKSSILMAPRETNSGLQ